jgi:hypothetical protein
LGGAVEARFVFATALGEDLVPFGFRRKRLVVLPLLREPSDHVANTMIDAKAAAERGFLSLAKWLATAERLWKENRKETTTASLVEWIDYHGKLTRQTPEHGVKVLYNTSGSHIAAAVLESGRDQVEGVQTSGFAVDQVMFSTTTQDAEEAHYLVAFLNAPYVNDAIKEFQPRGLFGARAGKGQRHITRLPLELLPIPIFDSSNQVHKRLSELSRICHDSVLRFPHDPTEGTGSARARVRTYLAEALTEIDRHVRAVLGAAQVEQKTAPTIRLFETKN